MKHITINEIIAAVQGSIYHAGTKVTYNDVCIDTRKIQEGNIFIAIKGENFNGNEYVEEASKKGAAICIVDEILFNSNNTEDCTIIKVEDTKKALRDLAKHYRNSLDIKVIGVTGSTGKTTTKDLIAAALSKKFKVFKTKGNFNNEIGLPLMIFNLDESYDVAVLEMGMSDFNEIHRLAEVARPDIAVITNIGLSHIENLGTRENILKAKMEIVDFFQKNNVLVLNGENDLLSSIHSKEFSVIKVGCGENSNYYSEDITLLEGGLEYNIIERNNKSSQRVYINMPGKHNVTNSLLAVACGKILGLEMVDIVAGFDNLEATSMRLDIIKCDEYTIINDCYNASPDSMKAALEVQSNMRSSRKIAVLGTMRELGKESYNAHREVGDYAREKGIDLLITLGEYWDGYKEGFDKDDCFFYFENAKDAGNYINTILRAGDLLLFKASRAMKFETIINDIKRSDC